MAGNGVKEPTGKPNEGRYKVVTGVGRYNLQSKMLQVGTVVEVEGRRLCGARGRHGTQEARW